MNSCLICGAKISLRATYCRSHQQNGPTPKPLSERLWAKVEKVPCGCWEWRGAKDRKGYGKIGVGSLKDGTRRIEITSRAAWIVTNGEIPNGLFVCHRCDNPSCCNPDHMFLGTCSDNLRDMAKKFRGTKKNRRLSDDTVTEILSLAKSMSQAKIGKMVGVTQSCVGRIIRGEVYRDIPRPPSSNGMPT